MGVVAIGCVAGAPKMLKAGGVVGELGEEFRYRVIRGRRLRAAGLVAVGRWHVVKLLDTEPFVKRLYKWLGPTGLSPHIESKYANWRSF